MNQAKKIAVIGSDAPAAAIARACATPGLASEIILCGEDTAETPDAGSDWPAVIVHTRDPGRVTACQIIVFSGNWPPPQLPLDARARAAAQRIARVTELKIANPLALFVIAGDLPDIAVHAAIARGGIDPARVLGLGTVARTTQFRRLIGQRCHMDAREVVAFIAGAATEAELPLWSSASISSVPLHQWAVMGHGKLTVRDRIDLFQNSRHAAPGIDGHGGEYGAAPDAAADICDALIQDVGRVLPISAMLQDFHGIDGISLATPRIISSKGVEAPVSIEMNDAEMAGMANSAAVIRALVEGLDPGESAPDIRTRREVGK